MNRVGKNSEKKEWQCCFWKLFSKGNTNSSMWQRWYSNNEETNSKSNGKVKECNRNGFAEA